MQNRWNNVVAAKENGQTAAKTIYLNNMISDANNYFTILMLFCLKKIKPLSVF